MATIGELNFLNIDGEAADLERKYNKLLKKTRLKRLILGSRRKIINLDYRLDSLDRLDRLVSLDRLDWID